MSIVKMQRVAVIGLDADREKLMSQLMDFGAVELTDQSGKLSKESWAKFTSSGHNPQGEMLYDEKLNKASEALEVLEKYGDLKHPLFKTRRPVKKSQLKDMFSKESKYEDKANYLLKLNDEIQSLSEEINKLDQDRASLAPWEAYDLPLEITSTKTTDVVMGILPMGTDVESLKKQLEEAVDTIVFKVVGSDKDMYYTAAIYPKDKQEQTMELLKNHGFTQSNFKGFAGTVKENMDRIEADKTTIIEKKEKTINKVKENSDLEKIIENYYDLMTINLESEEIKSKLLKTKTAFFIEGWIPARCVDKAKEILNKNECYYQFRDPKDDEEVPVLLNNDAFVVPFESVTEMYSLPAYRGFDPTKIFSVFYAVFFGMMLSDAGYGIVMALACYIVLKKFDLEGSTYKMMKLFFYCGISTAIWGALFGGWFGDFIQVFAKTILGKEVVIKPLWFNPVEDPMKLLIFSLALGVIHIFIGMGIKCYMQIKDGQWVDAICDQGFWYLLILGLIGLLAGGSISPAVSATGKWLAIAGAAGLLLTGGRKSKSIFGKIIGGLGSIYNITSYMSDILSYARILALGLATGVIAQVVNTMGSMLGGGVLGFITLIIAFVVGHTMNLAINMLGAFIHASRLQYIEFFGKFYEDGGEPFDPFCRKTKYIRVLDE